MSVILDIINSKLYLPKDPTSETGADFTDRTIIVTGSNVGLGFEASIKFIQLGAKKVILAVRSADKGNAAKAEIERRTGRAGVAEVWTLDMLDYNSIKTFAARADKELDRLDIAVLNAGVFGAKYENSTYGWERTLQVNLLSTTLLALLLMPKMKRSKSADFTPVLEIVNSGRYEAATLKPEVLDGRTSPLEAADTSTGYDGGTQYGMSKLLLMYVVQQLSADAKDSTGKRAVYVQAVCPGATVSDLSRDVSGPVMDVVKSVVFTLLFRTTEQGSRTYISGTTLGEAGHGRLWQSDQIKPRSSLLTGSEGAELQMRTWDAVIAALSKDVPELTSIKE